MHFLQIHLQTAIKHIQLALCTGGLKNNWLSSDKTLLWETNSVLVYLFFCVKNYINTYDFTCFNFLLVFKYIVFFKLVHGNLFIFFLPEYLAKYFLLAFKIPRRAMFLQFLTSLYKNILTNVWKTQNLSSYFARDICFRSPSKDWFLHCIIPWYSLSNIFKIFQVDIILNIRKTFF